jgi:hypothetical protein
MISGRTAEKTIALPASTQGPGVTLAGPVRTTMDEMTLAPIPIFVFVALSALAVLVWMLTDKHRK